MAVWSKKWYIVGPLVAVILGHWSLLLHGNYHSVIPASLTANASSPAGLLLTAVWDPVEGCVITQTDNAILSSTFIYSMGFDFVVLCLTAFKLFFPSNTRSRLVTLIFGDGLIYFVIA